MLTIKVNFVMPGLTPGLKGGEYVVADGSSVRDVLAVCEARCGAEVPPDNLKLLYPLFNGKPVEMDSSLHVDGTLYFCRIIFGG